MIFIDTVLNVSFNQFVIEYTSLLCFLLIFTAFQSQVSLEAFLFCDLVAAQVFWAIITYKLIWSSIGIFWRSFKSVKSLVSKPILPYFGWGCYLERLKHYFIVSAIHYLHLELTNIPEKFTTITILQFSVIYCNRMQPHIFPLRTPTLFRSH